MTGWTHERLELCRDMWNAGGMSATDIGRRLGTGRNSVISAAHRYREQYGFMVKARKGEATTARPPQRSKAQNRADGALAQVVRRARAAAKQPLRSPEKPADARNEDAGTSEPQGKPVTLLELSNGDCRWPVGKVDGPDTLFCGAQSQLGTPYCEYHNAKARSKSQPQGRTKPARRGE